MSFVTLRRWREFRAIARLTTPFQPFSKTPFCMSTGHVLCGLSYCQLSRVVYFVLAACQSWLEATLSI